MCCGGIANHWKNFLDNTFKVPEITEFEMVEGANECCKILKCPKSSIKRGTFSLIPAYLAGRALIDCKNAIQKYCSDESDDVLL